MEITRPNRIRHTYTQTIVAPPERVFPLLCPVRETEWTLGWNPKLIVSDSGVAEAECVFVMPGQDKDAEDTVWTITRHQPESFELEMRTVTPGRTAGKIEIALSAAGGDRTHAKIAYAHTSLGPEGDAFLEGFTKEWFQSFMKAWEEELNYFLSTGNKLPG